MLRKFSLPVLLVCLITLAAAAQGPGPALEGTQWDGHERLDALAALSIRFEKDGTATVTRGGSAKPGKYVRTGSSVIITLDGSKVVYEGQLNGTVLGGLARDPRRAGQWTWTVTRKGAAPVDPAATAPAGNTKPLSEEELPGYLRQMGFTPKVVAPGVGPAYCVIQEPSGGADFTVELNVQRGLWMIVPLRQLPAPEQLPAEKLLRLLEANSGMAPAFFCYRAGDNRLCLKLEVIGNRPSEKDFRADLKMIVDAARQSRDLWGDPGWDAPPTKSRR